MEYSKEITRYCKKKYRGGGTMLSAALNFVTAFIILFVILYAVLIMRFQNVGITLTLSLLICASVFVTYRLWSKRRLNKFIKREIDNLQDAAISEYLLMLDNNEFNKAIKAVLKSLGFTGIEFQSKLIKLKKEGVPMCAVVIKNHPTHKVTADDVLKVKTMCEQRSLACALLISTADFDDDAAAFLKRIGEIKSVSPAELVRLVKSSGALNVDSLAQELAAKMLHSSALSAKEAVDRVLKKGKYKAFLLCGVLSLLWSYFGGFNALYVAISAVSFGVAALIYFKGKKK